MNTFERPYLWPIVRKSLRVSPFEFENFAFDAREAFKKSLEKLPGQATKPDTLFRLIECFLQITAGRLSKSDFKTEGFADFCFNFVGALNSHVFVEANRTWRHSITRTFIKSVAGIPGAHALCRMELKSSTVLVHEDLRAHIGRFEILELVEERAWLWHGWPCTNRNGEEVQLQLLGMYTCLGRDYTIRFHAACNEFIAGRNISSIRFIKELSIFLGQSRFREVDLSDSSRIGVFWREFFCFVVEGEYIKGNKLYSTAIAWRNHFLPFVRECLIPHNLVAEPWGEYPNPPIRISRGVQTNLGVDEEGQEVRTKLLTDVPLQVTETEAIQLLFRDIQRDRDMIVSWAWTETSRTWSFLDERKRMSALGTPRISGALNDPHWKATPFPQDHESVRVNMFATFTHYGFTASNAKPDVQLLYPSPFAESARRLGLPVGVTLLPMLAILVSEHPAITTSYLENLELWDRNGKLVGFVPGDSGVWRLVGMKRRRGRELAQQAFNLTSDALGIVRLLIEITQPLRDYMKAKGDPDWRYLLLYCSSGFNKPKRVRTLSGWACRPEVIEKIAGVLGQNGQFPSDHAKKIATRFSLSTLRATEGVLVYLRTGSAERASEALGHKEFEPKLMDRYLPRELTYFFMERWIRIFQNGVIAEAMKDSPKLLESTDFHSLTELHEFLSKHVFVRPKDDDGQQTNTDASRVVFGVNLLVLVPLLSLQLAVERATRNVSPIAQYWSGVSERLTTYLLSEESNRDDLRQQLLHAKRLAVASTMEALIHDS